MTQTPSSGSSRPGPAATGLGATAGSTAGVVDQAQDTVGQVFDQAQQVAGQVTGQAKQQATSQLETQKERVVDSLVSVAQALRQTSQHLHEQEQGAVAGYVDQVAERAEGVTNYLRGTDVPGLLDDTQDLARRQPGLFMVSALALGFVGARFLMTSGRREMQRQRALAHPARPYSDYGALPYPPTGAQATARQTPAYGTTGATGNSGASQATGHADMPGVSGQTSAPRTPGAIDSLGTPGTSGSPAHDPQQRPAPGAHGV